jgi:NitT/TauT family transport system substrate-binding protein
MAKTIRVGTTDRRRFLYVSAALTLSALSKGHAGETGKALKVGSITIVNFAVIYRFKTIAKRYGFDVELVNFPSGTERLNALAAGYLDCSPTGSTQPILLRSKGVPIKIVADICRKGKGLMVAKGINGFADLRGKDIGTVRGATTDIWLRQKLSDEGLSPDRDVNLVNMDYLQMATAVLSQRVAAASGAEPQIAAFEAKGGRVLSYLTETKLGDIDAVMCFMEALLQKDRGQAKAVVAALAQASLDLQRDPELVPMMMAEIVKMDPDIIRQSLKNLAFFIKPDEKALSNLAMAMKDLNLIERVPATAEYLDLSLVNEI